MGNDYMDNLLLKRLEIINTTTEDLEDCNSMLTGLKGRIEQHIAKEAGVNQYSASSLNKLRKERVVFYCSLMMSLFEVSSTSNVRLIGSEMGEKVEEVSSAPSQPESLSQEKEEINTLMVENMGLKSELLTDKRIIIDLQQQIVSKSNITVKEVEKAVQSELKSYSAIVKSSCYEALAPKKIERAVKRATVVADGRDNNLIVYGLPEAENENCAKEVGPLFEVVGEKPPTIACVRLGAQKAGIIRPVKVTLRNSEQVLTTLKKSSKLKESEKFKTVFLSRDYTVEERIARRQLVDEFKKKKLEEPGKKFKIDFNFKRVVVISESNSTQK